MAVIPVAALAAFAVAALSLAAAAVPAIRARGTAPPAGTTIRIAAASGAFRFEPDVLRVTAGSPVRLQFANRDAIPHDFTLPGGDPPGLADPRAKRELLAHFALFPGKTVTLEFAAPALPGVYPFQCSIAGHTEAGMVGTLVVDPPRR